MRDSSLEEHPAGVFCVQAFAVDRDLRRKGACELAVDKQVCDELAAHDSPDANPSVVLQNERVGKVAFAKTHKVIVCVNKVCLRNKAIVPSPKAEPSAAKHEGTGPVGAVRDGPAEAGATRPARAPGQARKVDPETAPRMAQDAAFAAPTARKTLWAANGPQSGAEGFAQLDGTILRGLARGRTAAEARCSASGEAAPAKPQLDGLENGTTFRARRIRHRMAVPLTSGFAGDRSPA